MGELAENAPLAYLSRAAHRIIGVPLLAVGIFLS